MDAGNPDLAQAADIGADRIELYTGPYAEAHAAGDATVMLCDLASQDSVRAFAQSFRRKALPLHGVLCCAGVILQVRVSPFIFVQHGQFD